MASNGAYICDIKSDQVIEGKKTFTREVATPSLIIDKAVKITHEGSGARLKIDGHVEAASFSGDGANIQNISFENFSTNIERTRAAHNEDMVLVQQRSNPKGIFKIDTKSFFSLIPTYNGITYNFVTNGKSVGEGCKILRDRTTTGRSVELNYRTLTFGPNLCGKENEDEINIMISPDVSVEKISVTQAFIAPRVAQESIEAPVSGMIIYDSTVQKFLGYVEDRWIELITT